MSHKVVIEVFYSKTCPNCPPQKELAKSYEDEEGVKVRLTDAGRKKGRAENHGVRVVPTTVVDGPALDQKTGFKGVMAEEKMETAIEVAKGEKDPEALKNPGIIDRIKSFVQKKMSKDTSKLESNE